MTHTVTMINMEGDRVGIKIDDKVLEHVKGYKIERMVDDVQKVTFTIYCEKVVILPQMYGIAAKLQERCWNSKRYGEIELTQSEFDELSNQVVDTGTIWLNTKVEPNVLYVMGRKATIVPDHVEVAS